VESGPPAAYPGGNQAALYRVPARPQHATRDTRGYTGLLAGFGQPANPVQLLPGHDLAAFDPNHAAAALVNGVTVPNTVLPRRTLLQQQQQQQQLAGAPGVLLNGVNSCFAASAITFLCSMQVTNILSTLVIH
jgi:hypothetical protein